MHAIKRDRGKPICNEKVLLSFLLPCFRKENYLGKNVPLRERSLSRDFELVAVSLDLNLVAEVTGLAVHLHTLEHEGFEVGNIEDLIVCRGRAVDGELLDFFLLGWWHFYSFSEQVSPESESERERDRKEGGSGVHRLLARSPPKRNKSRKSVVVVANHDIDLMEGHHFES